MERIELSPIFLLHRRNEEPDWILIRGGGNVSISLHGETTLFSCTRFRLLSVICTVEQQESKRVGVCRACPVESQEARSICIHHAHPALSNFPFIFTRATASLLITIAVSPPPGGWQRMNESQFHTYPFRSSLFSRENSSWNDSYFKMDGYFNKADDHQLKRPRFGILYARRGKFLPLLLKRI